MKYLIWKQSLPIQPGLVKAMVPKDSVLLDLQAQDGVPTMWFRFPAKNADKKYIELSFIAAMTGHEFELHEESFANDRHVEECFIGTVQIGDMESAMAGPFVLHYFEVAK